MTTLSLPPYNTFPILEAELIVLRQICSTDIENILKISTYDAKRALTIEDAVEMQKKINLDYQNGSSIHWGIANKATNEIMGTVGYYRGFENKKGEIGFVLRAKYRGQGVMSTAIKLVTEFGLNTISLEKVTAITTRQNLNAIKLLERANFIKVADLENDRIEYHFK
jgi:ribosomal-protein-alanine N-acetyltransferase